MTKLYAISQSCVFDKSRVNRWIYFAQLRPYLRELEVERISLRSSRRFRGTEVSLFSKANDSLYEHQENTRNNSI